MSRASPWAHRPAAWPVTAAPRLGRPTGPEPARRPGRSPVAAEGGSCAARPVPRTGDVDVRRFGGALAGRASNRTAVLRQSKGAATVSHRRGCHGAVAVNLLDIHLQSTRRSHLTAVSQYTAVIIVACAEE